MVQICSIGCIYKRNDLHLCTLLILITLIEYMQNFIQPPARVAKEQVSADYPGTFFRSSGLFRDYPDTFSRLFRHFLIVWKLSRSSTLFLDYLDTFSRLIGHFQDHPETFQIIQTHFQIIQTLFRLSRHIFEIIWTLFRSYGNFPDHPCSS